MKNQLTLICIHKKNEHSQTQTNKLVWDFLLGFIVLKWLQNNKLLILKVHGGLGHVCSRFWVATKHCMKLNQQAYWYISSLPH